MKAFFIIVGIVNVCSGIANDSLFTFVCGIITIIISLFFLGEK